MTPRSEEIVLERAARRADGCEHIDAETVCAIEEILRTNREGRAQDFARLVSLIGYRRAAFTREQEVAYAMGEVAGMCRMAYEDGRDA